MLCLSTKTVRKILKEMLTERMVRGREKQDLGPGRRKCVSVFLQKPTGEL